jgi:hypothetical protein
MLWIIAGIAVVGAAAWGPIVSSNVEQAKYEVVETYEAVEIRDYAPHIVAEVSVSGERKEAINQGFRLIADYIFGNNTASAQVAMTTPVIQQPVAQESNERIAMTVPVIQEGSGNAWNVRFVMPASYTLVTLPKPNNDAVTLREVEGKRYAALRFSGIADTDSIQEKTRELNQFIAEKELKPLAEATFAFYNPPWTLPFLRRNEVMVEIEK